MNTRNARRRLRNHIYSLTLIGGLVVAAGMMSAAVHAERASYYPSMGSTGAVALAPASDRLLSATMLAAPAPPLVEAVSTYASDCTTPQASFSVGDTVCVKTSGVPLSPFFPHRLILTNANNTVVFSANITSDPQTNSFTVDPTSVIGGVTVDNRGTWHAYVLNPFFFFAEATTAFTLDDPHNATADVGVAATGSANTAQAGSQVSFEIEVKNYGPDNSANVQLTNAVPDNTTFVSFQQVSGPTFVCSTPNAGDTGTISCSNSSLAWPGPSAVFVATYQLDSNVATGALIINTANISSDTNDQNAFDDSASATITVSNPAGGPTCSFDCPENIVTTATDQNGAIVNFPSATNVVGDCGAISASPHSGSVFPVGTTVVTVTSDAGPSCSFSVTVSDTPAPTITCPPDKIATADSSGSAVVNVGTPVTTPSTGVTVSFERSDSTPGNLVLLTDPFPTGTTGITWTVTDSIGRKASCTQLIVVHPPCASDTQPPTITAPPDVTIGTGANSTTCGVVLDEGQLGQPVAHDDCAVVVSTSGIPAGHLFPVGTTTVTYTASDGAGHTASATQHVTVNDNTPPVIFAPPDASYTCPSDVPALSPSQATGPPIIVNGQEVPGPVFDNCGNPTVTASQTSSGQGSAASPLVIVRTYTAVDTHGNSASAIQTITVIDATPPVFTFVPGDVTAYTGPNATTCDAVVNPGAATATDNCGVVTVTRSPSGNTFPVGTTTVTWTATDGAGNTTTATQQVTVIDNTPPVITTNGQTPSMWPPNHKYQTFQVSNFVTSVFDNCGGISVADVTIDKVTSDEAESAAGSGDTLNDIVISADCKSVQLRSEREGGGDGRVYTITFKVTDTHGNIGTTTSTVVVPHNPGETPVNSGVHYTVNGTCQ